MFGNARAAGPRGGSQPIPSLEGCSRTPKRGMERCLANQVLPHSGPSVLLLLLVLRHVLVMDFPRTFAACLERAQSGTRAASCRPLPGAATKPSAALSSRRSMRTTARPSAGASSIRVRSAVAGRNTPFSSASRESCRAFPMGEVFAPAFRKNPGRDDTQASGGRADSTTRTLHERRGQTPEKSTTYLVNHLGGVSLHLLQRRWAQPVRLELAAARSAKVAELDIMHNLVDRFTHDLVRSRS